VLSLNAPAARIANQKWKYNFVKTIAKSLRPEKMPLDLSLTSYFESLALIMFAHNDSQSGKK